MAALLATAWPAHAQDDPGSIERTIPKLEVEPADEKPRVAAPALPTQSGARVAGTFVLGAVNVEGATVFSSEELAPSFEPFLASRVGQPELDKIAANITDRYRTAGYLLSYAMVPEQSVQSGIVRIRVVEGFVDRVQIRASMGSAAAVRELVEKLSAERPLQQSTLERALGLVRDMPGILLTDTRISRSPGNPARHQLTITLRPERLRALVYTDNRGTIEGARMRAYSSFNLASLAVPGDHLQIDLFSIPSRKFRFLYGQARASVPLNADGLRFSASVSRGDQWRRLPGANQHGKSRQLVADIAYPFAKSRAFSLVGHATLGDWKSEEDRAGTIVQRDRIQVARAWVEFARLSKTRIDGRIGLSRGLDFGSATRAGELLASRPGAGAQFTKIDAQVQVAAPLSQRLLLRLNTEAQYSSKPLLAPEEFALGGSRIGRAFDFNEVTGDHGLGGMLELSYRIAESKHGLKRLELFAFADGGGAFRKHSSPGLPDEQWLASTGAGARMIALGFLWSAEVGVPVARSRADPGVRAFFSAVRAF